MNRVSIVQSCLDHTAGRTYVEIGVAFGACFARIRAGTKIAVDPHLRMAWWRRRLSERRAAASHYVILESDEFFKRQASLLCPSGIDVAFIDGLHTCEQALRDVDNALAHLGEGGVIVLHDCNPETPIIGHPAATYRDFRRAHPWHVRWSGDVWKTIVQLRSTRPDLEVAVLDCDFGVGLVKRGRPEATLDYTIEDIRSMDYDDLEKQRQRILNLQEPDYLHRFLRRAPVSTSAGG